MKKPVLKNVAIFLGRYLYWSFFLQGCNFIKKRLQQRCFPVNIAKVLRTPILKEEHLRMTASVRICERLLPFALKSRLFFC